MQKSRFLIGWEIEAYLKDIDSRSINLKTTKEQFTAKSKGVVRQQYVTEHYAELAWLTDQLPLLPDKFEPHLILFK